MKNGWLGALVVVALAVGWGIRRCSRDVPNGSGTAVNREAREFSATGWDVACELRPTLLDEETFLSLSARNADGSLFVHGRWFLRVERQGRPCADLGLAPGDLLHMVTLRERGKEQVFHFGKSPLGALFFHAVLTGGEGTVEFFRAGAFHALAFRNAHPLATEASPSSFVRREEPRDVSRWQWLADTVNLGVWERMLECGVEARLPLSLRVKKVSPYCEAAGLRSGDEVLAAGPDRALPWSRGGWDAFETLFLPDAWNTTLWVKRGEELVNIPVIHKELRPDVEGLATFLASGGGPEGTTLPEFLRTKPNDPLPGATVEFRAREVRIGASARTTQVPTHLRLTCGDAVDVRAVEKEEGRSVTFFHATFPRPQNTPRCLVSLFLGGMVREWGRFVVGADAPARQTLDER